MSRIGTFADDDLAGWVLKSPELGSAIGAFANAVYGQEPAGRCGPAKLARDG